MGFKELRDRLEDWKDDKIWLSKLQSRRREVWAIQLHADGGGKEEDIDFETHQKWTTCDFEGRVRHRQENLDEVYGAANENLMSEAEQELMIDYDTETKPYDLLETGIDAQLGILK